MLRDSVKAAVRRAAKGFALQLRNPTAEAVAECMALFGGLALEEGLSWEELREAQAGPGFRADVERLLTEEALL